MQTPNIIQRALHIYPSNHTRSHHHLSQLSSSFLPIVALEGPLAFLTAEVPMALGLLLPASAKLSQKSFLLSSSGAER
jgi:hypothetical protein